MTEYNPPWEMVFAAINEIDPVDPDFGLLDPDQVLMALRPLWGLPPLPEDDDGPFEPETRDLVFVPSPGIGSLWGWQDQADFEAEAKSTTFLWAKVTQDGVEEKVLPADEHPGEGWVQIRGQFS